MKVLYLFNRVRDTFVADMKKGEESDNSFFGMYRLPHFGVQAEYLEIEQVLPLRLAEFLRRHFLNIHYVHLPLFFRFFKYDVIFTSTAFGSLLVKSMFRLRKPKWIMFDFSITGMIGDAKTFRQKVFRFMVTHGADGIITLSKEEEKKAKKMFPKLANRIQYIPLGTDVSYYSPDSSVLEDGGILSVGRDPYRDFGTLISAVHDIDIPVLIITKPANVAKYLPLSKNIQTKTVTTPELLREYRKAKIVVLPLAMKDRLNEGVGCSTLMEMMAMGKAIIATRTFTMESYITDGENGVLVPEGDKEALKKAIMDLWNDEAKRKRLGNSAREFAVKYCDAEKFTENLADYFKKIESS